MRRLLGPLAALCLGMGFAVLPAGAAGASQLQEATDPFTFRDPNGTMITCYVHVELFLSDRGDGDVTNDRLYALTDVDESGGPDCASRDTTTLRYTVDSNPDQDHTETVGGADYAFAEAIPPKVSTFRNISSHHHITFTGCGCGPTYDFTPAGPK